MKTVMEMSVYLEDGKFNVTLRDAEYTQTFYVRSGDPYIITELLKRAIELQLTEASFAAMAPVTPPSHNNLGTAEFDPGFEATTTNAPGNKA